MTIAAEAEATELYVDTLIKATAAEAEATELYVETLVTGPSQGGEVTELYVETLIYVGIPDTERCDLWLIERTDGQVFAFTSLDEDFVWRGVTYKTCSSLVASATTSASEMGSVGDQELNGVLSDDAITDADLHAGMFDDAYVEVWRVAWGENPDPATPRMRHSGYLGKVTRKEATWVAEVLGQGARLQQSSTVKICTPACRFVFGLFDPALGSGCPFNLEAVKAAGCVTVKASNRTVMTFTGTETASMQWDQGKIHWLTGKNAGKWTQVEVADWGAGILSLWEPMPFVAAAGDTFDLYPGCRKTPTDCLTYGLYPLSFGGFKDVPGPDAMQSNADSMFTGNNA